MTNQPNLFQPAIDALEKDYADLERQANGLLTSINLLRAKSGLPPKPGGGLFGSGNPSEVATSDVHAVVKLHSDSFTGKKLSVAVREYLEMRKASGGDAPATSREIFDALKEGGFSSGAKDDATALVVLRTMLRKSSSTFAKLQNGKYGLRAWYPHLKAQKGVSSSSKTVDEDDEDETSPENIEAAATQKTAAA